MGTEPTTTTTTTTPALSISIDQGYVYSLFGKLNIILLILNFICIICSLALPYIPAGGWFYFVCTTGFFFVLTNFLLGLCRVQDRLVRIVQWKLAVLIIRALWTLFYLIAASCAASAGANYVDRQGWFAAAFFGFVAMAVYAYDAYQRYVDWKGAPPAVSPA